MSLRLTAGTGTVLQGVALGLAGAAVVGVADVLAASQAALPADARAHRRQDLGWLPRHATPFALPGWLGPWFEMYSSWVTLGAQVLAALLVIGSYRLAEHLKVRRPRARGETPAVRAEAPPQVLAEAA